MHSIDLGISNISSMTKYEKVCVKKNTVLFKDYKQYGKYSAENIFSRFNTWDEAVLSAGLEPTGFARSRISEYTLFNEIERIWTKLGRQPSSTDIIKSGISKYSLDTYKRRFGGWRKALEAFVEFINQDNTEEDHTNDNANSINDMETVLLNNDSEKNLKLICLELLEI